MCAPTSPTSRATARVRSGSARRAPLLAATRHCAAAGLVNRRVSVPRLLADARFYSHALLDAEVAKLATATAAPSERGSAPAASVSSWSLAELANALDVHHRRYGAGSRGVWRDVIQMVQTNTLADVRRRARSESSRGAQPAADDAEANNGDGDGDGEGDGAVGDEMALANQLARELLAGGAPVASGDGDAGNAGALVESLFRRVLLNSLNAAGGGDGAEEGGEGDEDEHDDDDDDDDDDENDDDDDEDLSDSLDEEEEEDGGAEFGFDGGARRSNARGNGAFDVPLEAISCDHVGGALVAVQKSSAAASGAAATSTTTAAATSSSTTSTATTTAAAESTAGSSVSVVKSGRAFAALKSVPLPTLQFTFAAARIFNAQLCVLMQLLDFSNVSADELVGDAPAASEADASSNAAAAVVSVPSTPVGGESATPMAADEPAVSASQSEMPPPPRATATDASSSISLVRAVYDVKDVIFSDTKSTLWQRALQLTAGGGPGQRMQYVSITVNRHKARKAAERVEEARAAGDMSPASASTVLRSAFGQAFKQLHFQPPHFLRTLPGHRAFGVEYEGEGGTDAGGLFRDLLSHVCRELQSPSVPLLVPTPNARGQVGDAQDCWVPAASASSPVFLAMYAFIGKLMGLAVRGQHILNLDLPPLVWRVLVGEQLSLADLRAVDVHGAAAIEAVSTAAARGATDDESFAELAQAPTWSVTLCDGSVRELRTNCAKQPVAFEERRAWLRAARRVRLQDEWAPACNALRRGLAAVVPLSLLSFLSAAELERQVCGEREVDLALLRRQTRYSRLRADSQLVRWFWRALESYDQKQRESFLRFAWGRSRLPLRADEFTHHFVLTAAHGNDKTLPSSHTCFFQLDLPEYSSYEILRERLLYACEHGQAIDTDHGNIRVWDDRHDDEDDGEDEAEVMRKLQREGMAEDRNANNGGDDDDGNN
jgi:hypothetical protein